MKTTYAQVSQEERDKYFEEQERKKAAQQGVQRMGFWAWLKMSFRSIAHRK